MDSAALVIAILAFVAALVIAGFSMFIQFRLYQATTDQLRHVEQLVGELRGMTGKMSEAQERQFGTMLDAFVTRPGAANEAAEKAKESAAELSEIREELESLASRAGENTDLEAMQQELRLLRERVESVSQTAASAARLARTAVRPRFADEAQMSASEKASTVIRVSGGVVQLGEVVEVRVQVVSSPKLIGAYAIDLHYDPKILHARAAQSVAGPANLEFAPDLVRLVGADANGLPAANFEIGRVTFAAAAPGSAHVIPHIRQLADTNGTDLPFMAHAAEVIVVGPHA